MSRKLVLPAMLVLIPVMVIGTLYAVFACPMHGASCGMGTGSACGMAAGGQCGMKDCGQCAAGMMMHMRAQGLLYGQVALAVMPMEDGTMVRLVAFDQSHQRDRNASISASAINPDKALDLQPCGLGAACGKVDLGGAKGLLVRVSHPGMTETVYFGLQRGGGAMQAGACGQHCQQMAGGRCSMMESGACKEMGACKQAGAASVCPMHQGGAAGGCKMMGGGCCGH